jgi:hypothetical protein
VHVDFRQKQAVVVVNGEQYDRAALLTALEREGFRGKVLKETDV